MIAVAFEEKKHYPLLLVWWMERKFPATPLPLLPRTGIVMEDEKGTPLCAGFLYLTDSGCAHIGHLVSSPSSDKEKRSLAIDILILTLLDLAKLAGKTIVAGATNLPHLVKRYEKLGFTAYDQGVTHLSKELA